MNSENWQPIVMAIIGGLVTVVLGLIGVIMVDIKKNLQRLWQAVVEINNTLVRDKERIDTIKEDLNAIESKEDLHFEQIKARLHDLHKNILSPLQLKVQHIEDTLERIAK